MGESQYKSAKFNISIIKDEIQLHYQAFEQHNIRVERRSSTTNHEFTRYLPVDKKNYQATNIPSLLILFPPTYFNLVITYRGAMIILPRPFFG